MTKTRGRMGPTLLLKIFGLAFFAYLFWASCSCPA